MQRRTRLVSGLATAALFAGGALAVAPASDAAGKKITAPIDCPKAYPDSKIAKGLKGTGFTVSSGTKAEPFSATVIGKLDDFPEPGSYLVLARIASPAVTAAHGDWAGISGSPVYSSDGLLIGSTSYSFGINSDIVGLTPGSALLPVLNGVPHAAARAHAGLQGQAHKSLSAAQLKAAVAAGVPAAAADAGVTVSPVALTASGHVTKRFLDLVKKIPGTRYVGVSGAASGAAVKPSTLHAGDNFVAAVSFGEASLYAAGTTTAVCKGKAVAFGHPFFDSGPASLTAHTASTVVVQPDSLFGAYKLVNPDGVVGTVDADLTNGIRASLGVLPKRLTQVTSQFTFGHKVVKGSTTVSDPDYAPLAAAIHTQSDLAKAFGYEGKGSAKVTIGIKGLRADGKAFSLTRKDVWSDPYDLPYVVADTVYSMVSALSGQEFEDVRLTGINITGTLSSSVNRYSATRIEAKQGSSWVKIDGGTISATPGSTLPVRVTLTPYKGIGTTKVVDLSVTVPASATGQNVGLDVSIGAQDFDVSGATSFSDILRIVAATPTNDQITAALVDGDSGTTLSRDTRHVGAALAPGGAFASVDLGTGGEPGGGAPVGK